MLRLYKECEEFGEYNSFDTTSGKLSEISEEEYETLKNQISPQDIFEGGNPAHSVFPRRIYFQITRRCNLRCPYCFIKANSKEKDLSIEYIRKMISYLGRKGLMEVRLTGGEPTLRTDFPSIVEEFYTNNVYVSVATNGLWSPEILDFFCCSKNLWLIISVDGDENIHNRYRENSYRKIVENLTYLREQNQQIRLRLNTVLTKETVQSIESVFSLGAKIRAESITFIPLRPQVRDGSIKEKILTATEFKVAVEKMLECKRKYHVDFTTAMEALYKEEFLPDKIFKKHSSCAAGREGTNLDYSYETGEWLVYGCSYSPASDNTADPAIREPFLAGHFAFDDIEKLEQLWNDDIRWAIYRNLDFKSSICCGCEYFTTRCTGSCPIQNLNYDELKLDKAMIKQLHEQIKQNGEWYCYKNFL